MQKDLEFLEWDEEIYQTVQYRMVQGHVGITSTPMPGMRSTSTTLQSDVHLAYHHKRKLSELEESSRKLYDLLYAVSSVMGVWDQDEDEDV